MVMAMILVSFLSTYFLVSLGIVWLLNIVYSQFQKQRMRRKEIQQLAAND